MPRLTPPDDDQRLGRAWAAFVEDDTKARPPAGLEARVMRAAQAAVAAQRRAEADRRRHHWLAGVAALAASALAAAAWSLMPHDAPAPAAATPAITAAPDTAASTPVSDETPRGTAGRSRPLPMTNVEAGRVLATMPPRALAARPLLQPIDGLVATPGSPRAKSFFAPPPVVRPNPVTPQLAQAPASPPADDASAMPGRLPAAAPLATSAPRPAAPEVWSTRGFQGVFDPATAAVPQPYRVDLAAPAPVRPAEEPPDPPFF
jgi:hypothetical protein